MATYEEFAKALEPNEELMAKYLELAREFSPKTDDEITQAKHEIAAKLGYDVSVKEFELEAIAVQELDEQELDQVTRGWAIGDLLASLKIPGGNTGGGGKCGLSHAKCNLTW